MKRPPKLGIRPVSFEPTAEVRRLLDQFVATGFWGRNPGTCVERIVERFLWGEISRPHLGLPRRKPEAR